MIVNLVRVAIFALMLGVGLSRSVRQLLSVWHRPDALARALLAIVVLFPTMTFVLLRLLALPTAVATGFAVLAAAPGPPLLVKRTEMAGGSASFGASLMLTLGVLAVAVTPLTLAVFYAFFDLQTERVGAMSVASQVAMAHTLPIGLGLVVQRFLPRVAAAITKPVALLANVLLGVVVLVVIVPAITVVSGVGVVTVLVAGALSIGGIAMGHLVGPSDQRERAAVAIGSIARNVGLAVFVVTLSGVQEEVAPTILTYLLMGVACGVPYSIWSKRQLARS